MNLARMNALCALVGSMLAGAAAFVPNHSGFRVNQPTSNPLKLMNGEVVDVVSNSAATAASHFNNMLIATIDADIANVPENEFAPIFAGGIMVMFGGVLSALIVGFILESNNSYANVIADSYAQGAEDEEFWKGLSDEEAKKTKELLQKLKESKEGGAPAAPAVAEPVAATSVEEAPEAPKSEPAASAEPTTASSAGKDMFSDY